MKEIILDGNIMDTKKKVHKHIKGKLDTLEYHGDNLDALWDVLSTYSKTVRICFINKSILIENLGTYGESLIKTFKDAAKENDNISFVIID